MQAAPLPPELRATAPAVAARLGAILMSLAALIARAFLHDPRRVALIVPLWRRLTRAARRFDRLMARLAAGTAPRPSRPGRSSGPRPIPLPSGHAWLIADLRHEAVAYASLLDHLLAEPATAAIIANSPQAVRLLRPICRMLGLRPAALPPRPRNRKPPRSPSPALAGPGVEANGTRSENAAPARVLPNSQERPPPLHETAPCPHVRWPWFPRRAATPA